MSSKTLQYDITFKSNADRITAGIDRLDDTLNGVKNTAGKMANGFSSAMDKMSSKLNTIRIDSFINNINHAADGLNAMASPGLKLNSSLLDLSAITDVAGDKLQEIEGYARQNAKTFGGEASAGVESYKLLLSQLSPEIANKPKALKEMGDNVSILSKQMGGNSAAATEVLTTAMNQYGVSLKDPMQASKEMSAMMNIMAAAAKEGSAELPAQKAALEKSGMAAKGANVSFAETAAAIQVLDKAGRKGSEGGTALNAVLSTLALGRFLPPEMQKELKSAGVDIDTLTNKSLTMAERMKPLKAVVNDTALITKLFGREHNNAALALINGITEQERLTIAIQGTNTAREQANIVMESQAEKNSRLKAQVDDFKISMFNATGGALGYASVLGDISRDVGNLIPLFSGAGKMIAFMTNSTKMQALWTGIVSTATSVWTGVQWALNVAMTANPIGLIIVAIGALVAGIVWLVSKVSGWGEYWEHTWNGAKLLFEAVVAGITANFNTMVNGLMIGINAIKIGWYKFKESMGLGDSTENQRMIQQISDDTEARKESIKDGYKKAAALALESAQEVAKGAMSLKWKSGDEESETSTDGTGISDPTVPGTTQGGGGTGGGGTGGGGKKSNTAIATGGSKHNYITITLQSLIEKVDIKGNDFKESAKQMQDQSSDALLRTLALAVTAGS